VIFNNFLNNNIYYIIIYIIIFIIFIMPKKLYKRKGKGIKDIVKKIYNVGKKGVESIYNVGKKGYETAKNVDKYLKSKRYLGQLKDMGLTSDIIKNVPLIGQPLSQAYDYGVSKGYNPKTKKSKADKMKYVRSFKKK